MREQKPEAERGTFGWRQLMGAVNLRDFSQMVAGELEMIGTTVRLALESLLRPPFGPVIFFAALLLAILRSVLLVLVVVVFGTAILIISAVRGAARIARRRSDSS